MSRYDIEGVKHKKKRSLIMFLKDGEKYKELQSLTKMERAVLDYLVKHMLQDLNTIIIQNEVREELISETGIKVSSLKTIISNLVRKGFIEKLMLPNEYIINPLLAYNGSQETVLYNYSKFENELRRVRGVKENITYTSKFGRGVF